MEIREQLFYIARMLRFCFHVFFCLSADLSELSTKLDETFRRLGYVTSNSWLGFLVIQTTMKIREFLNGIFPLKTVYIEMGLDPSFLPSERLAVRGP